MRTEDRPLALARVCERIVSHHRGQEEEYLADSLFHELRRMREVHDAPRLDDDRRFWSEVQAALPRGNAPELAALFERATRRYAEEICGNFNDRVYQLTTRVVPTALNALLNAFSPTKLVKQLQQGPGALISGVRSLEQTVLIQGET